MPNDESANNVANHPVRKRGLVLLAWYATDVFRGIARFARDAEWIPDSSYELTGQLPEGWRGDGIIGVLGVHPEVDRLAVKCKILFVNIGYCLPEVVPSVSADPRMENDRQDKGGSYRIMQPDRIQCPKHA